MKWEIKKIFQQIKKEFIGNKTVILKTIALEMQEWDYEIQLEKLLEVIDKYEEKEEIFKKEVESVVCEEYETLHEIGNVAVIHQNNPYVILALALIGIRTHNTLTFYLTDKLLAINAVLIQIIQKALKREDIINYQQVVKEEAFYKEQEQFDCLIYFGNQYEYFTFSKRLCIPSIFENFGEVYVFIDNTSFKDEFLQMDRFAYDYHICVKYYKGNLEEAIQNINRLGIVKTAVIYTNDKEKAYAFLENVKSEEVYINTNPFIQYEFHFDENKLVYKKRMICQ